MIANAICITLAATSVLTYVWWSTYSWHQQQKLLRAIDAAPKPVRRG